MTSKEANKFLDHVKARVESGQCSINFGLTRAFMEGMKVQLEPTKKAPPVNNRLVGVVLRYNGDLCFGKAAYIGGVWCAEDGTPLPVEPFDWSELSW